MRIQRPNRGAISVAALRLLSPQRQRHDAVTDSATAYRAAATAAAAALPLQCVVDASTTEAYSVQPGAPLCDSGGASLAARDSE